MVIKCKTFSALLAFVRGIHPSIVNSLHNGLWRGALMFSLICTWIDSWVNNREAVDLKCNRAHYDITVMFYVDSDAIWCLTTSQKILRYWLMVPSHYLNHGWLNMNDVPYHLLSKWFHRKYSRQHLLRCVLKLHIFKSLRPSDAIWWHRSGSTLTQVMAWCLTAPSHYLNQCWLIISKV